jgi:predicted enzyme involved in methoxymalonyl-ACP biosynthesis
MISVVICLQNGADTLEIDTWLMSCRVLKRQVEEATLNQIVRIARDLNCSRIKGRYRPSPKNSMVSDLYPRLGFSHTSTCPECSEFELDINNFAPFETHITVN